MSANNYTVQSDVVTAGESGHLACHSQLADNSAMLAPAARIMPTGTAAGDTAAIAAAVTALSSTGGTVLLGPGAFQVNTGNVTVQETGTAPIFIRGAGTGATIIQAIGGGDCIRMYNPTLPAGGFTSLAVYGGGVLDLTIDGSLASSGAVGLHIGDGEHYQVRCQIQKFTGTTGGPVSTGSVGLWIHNSAWWTEKGTWDVVFVNCTTGVLQTTSSGNNSNAENDFKWTFFQSASQNCINMQGVSHYLGKLEVRGVCNAGTPNTGVFLTADANSAINNCQIDIAINSGQSGTFHQTNNWATGFSFQSNWGRMLFNGGPWTAGTYPAVTWAGNQTAMSFAGDILGDTNITPAAFASGNGPPQVAMMMAGTPLAFAQGFARASDGKINDFAGDFFDYGVLSANVTVGLGGGTKGSLPGPQRKTIRAQQAAAGGPFTLTWPHNASPSTTAPKVLWAGGTAPVMTATASAVDYYFLETFDGATWVGRAAQNVS